MRPALRWTLIALGLLALGVLTIPYSAWCLLVWILNDEEA